MSAIIHALHTIRYTIPAEILKAAFGECGGYQLTSLDEHIRLYVIVNRVMRDINLVHGETAFLPLVEGEVSYLGDNQFSTFFTDEYLMGREIISATAYHAGMGISGNSVGYQGGPSGYSGGSHPANGYCNGQYSKSQSAALNSAMNAIDAQGSPYIPNVNTQLLVVAKNTIVSRNVNIYGETGAMEVQLSNDQELNNISPKSIPAFTELCILATKSYIYNKLYMTLAHSSIYAGQGFDQKNSYISDLSDAEEEYRRYLREEWARTSFMNDTTQYHELLKMQINPFS